VATLPGPAGIEHVVSTSMPSRRPTAATAQGRFDVVASDE